jgi:DNA-binding MarR family transcriptional regulator
MAGMKTVARFELCNCFAVRQAARHLTKHYERHLSGAELTSAQFSILAAIDGAGAMTMSELAKAMVMDRTTLVRAIKPLQQGELVISRPKEGSPRQLSLSLSAAGGRRLKKGLALWAKAQEEFEAAIGSAEAARMRRELLAVSRSIELP